MWPGALKLLLLITFLQHPLRCMSREKNFREKEKDVLDDILGPGRYDARIRPSGENATDGPAIVRVNLFVRSIATISDIKMEYSVQLTFREQWMDDRLQFDDAEGRLKYLTLTDASRVWMPDLFFSNEKEGHFHNIIMPNVYIRIFPHGSVLYSIRISLTLSCPMNLKLYPLDRQVCSLRMASYGWTTDDLVFLWKEGDPVQVVKNLHLPRFTLEKFLTDYCNSKTNTGEYSCLKVDLFFKREFSYYLIQIYIPCCMLVIVSWVSFWLDQSAVPARVSLGVTTLLTMATQTSGINASLPPVSYTKAIDIWTGVCLTFVFGALLEFALVNYASRSDMHSENMVKKYPPSETEQSTSMDLTSDQVEPDNASNFAMTGYDGPLQPSLQVVAIQVPDEVQAHRRHIENFLPNRIRFLQPNVLVQLPVPEGGGGRVNVDKEALGTRNVARGHSRQYHTGTTANTNARSHHRPRHRHQYYHYRPSHHHQHHLHHCVLPQQDEDEEEDEEEEEEEQQQQLPLSSHRHHHPRFYPGRNEPRSASFPSLHNAKGSGRCSPRSARCSPRSTRHSCKSSARSSPSTSPSPSPFPSPTPSPTTSRRATPSPPTPAGRTSFSRNDKCCWGLIPRSWFTSRDKGSARIDFIARRAFPLTFVLFNLGYWSNYLFQGKDSDNRQK
ncbi:glycine receptor alpha 1 isoform X3 [Augochlora pura]